MSPRPTEPRNPLSLGQRPGLSHDSRTGLGYGLAQDNFHSARSNSQEFPYSEDDHEEVELDITDDVLTKIVDKIATPYKSSDHLIGRSADHSAKVSGNSPVAIGEGVAKNSLVPFPNMYKNRLQIGGGVNSPKTISPGQYNRTGTYRGWSHAPVGLVDTEDDNGEDPALEKIRKLVKNVLKNNIEET